MDVRNSIILSWTPAAGTEVSCPGISASGSGLSTSENDPSPLFENFAQGNYALTPAGQTQFADIAIWEDGDPPFDFEGDARPATDGSSDFPGADTVP